MRGHTSMLPELKYPGKPHKCCANEERKKKHSYVMRAISINESTVNVSENLITYCSYEDIIISIM